MNSKIRKLSPIMEVITTPSLLSQDDANPNQANNANDAYPSGADMDIEEKLETTPGFTLITPTTLITRITRVTRIGRQEVGPVPEDLVVVESLPDHTNDSTNS